MKRLTMIMLFLLLWVTACNTGQIEPTTEAVTPTETALEAVEATETATPTETTAVRPTPTEEPAMTSEPATASTDPVIIFKRSGGIAGLEDEWTVYADGRVEGSPTTENPVSTEQIAQILADAEAGGFFDLQPDYTDPKHCCDFFTYEVTLKLADGRTHTVTTTEQVPGMPAALEQIIQQINVLLFQERIQE